MADFGIKATQMTDPNLKPASFVRQPVEDNSQAPILSTLGTLAKDAYTGYQLAGIERDQEAVIKEYMDRNHNMDVLDAGALRENIDKLWNNFDTTIEDVNPLEKTFQDKLKGYKNALDQGVMSSSEFSDRIMAVTREYVNKNPGMYDALLAHSKKVLDLSGITDIVQQDSKLAQDKQKQAQELTKYYMELAKSFNINIPFDNTGNINMISLVQQVNESQHQAQIVQTFKNYDETQNLTNHMQARQFMQQYGIQTINGLINESMSRGIALLNQGQDYQGVITAIKMDLNNVQQLVASKVGPIINEPAVKEALTYLEKQKTLVENLLVSAGTKEDAVKLSNNLQTLLRNSQYTELSKTVNPQALTVLTQAMAAIGPGRLLDENKDLSSKIMKTITNLVTGVAGSYDSDYTTDIGGKSPIVSGIESIIKQSVADPTKLEQLDNTLSTIAKDSKNKEMFKSPEDKFNFYEQLIRTLGKPETKEALSKLHPSSFQDATALMDDYMRMTLPSMNTSVKQWEDKGVKVTMDVLPDGRMIFITSNPQATKDLNSRYTPRINDSLQTMANLMGSDIRTTAKGYFYKQYFQDLKDPDLEPLNIKSPADAKKALDSGAINQNEYDMMVKEFSKVKPKEPSNEDLTQIKKDTGGDIKSIRVAFDELEANKKNLKSEEDPKMKSAWTLNIEELKAEIKTKIDKMLKDKLITKDDYDLYMSDLKD